MSSESSFPARWSRRCRRLASRKLLLAAIFATVLAQMIAMALISELNVHPDERHHVQVADYYLRWWLPPPAGDPRVIPSLSAYGFSYHYNQTLAYFLAGKAVAPIQDWIQNPFIAFRLCNVALFAALVGFALRRRNELYALLLLLCPAQVWYLFSCFNDDALALFLSLLCCLQVAVPDTISSRFLGAEDWRTSRRGAFALALILATLLLSKQNYHVFLVFLGFYAAWTVASAGDLARARRLGLKWCAVALAAVCLAWPRYAIDDWVNDPKRPGNRGLTKGERIHEVAESHATGGFRPTQAGTEDAYPGLRMKQRGVPFGDLFKMHWHRNTYMSLVGVYGYVSIYSDRSFYVATFIVYASLLATLIALVWRQGSPWDRLFALACSLFCAGLVLASAHHSWTVDFEPQGRYLFPGIGIAFVAILRLRALVPPRVLWRYGVVIWLLSCYSFLFTGLRLIPKLGS